MRRALLALLLSLLAAGLLSCGDPTATGPADVGCQSLLCLFDAGGNDADADAAADAPDPSDVPDADAAPDPTDADAPDAAPDVPADTPDASPTDAAPDAIEDAPADAQDADAPPDVPDVATDPLDADADADADPPRELTYFRDIKPIIDFHCLACHEPGGPGPIPLDSFAKVVASSHEILHVLESGEMPPWPPDPACRHYEHERLLTDQERADLGAWLSAGMAPGDPADFVERPRPPIRLDDATHIARPAEPYTPPVDVFDDYRCFLLDIGFEQDTYMNAYQILPGAPEIAHHALLFKARPDQVATIEGLDANDPGPGYRCFGGPMVDFERGALGAWVPGNVPQRTPEGSGFVLEAGSRIILQVHYNLFAAATRPDWTEVHMKLTTTRPEVRSWMLMVFDPTLFIPAGSSTASAVQSAENTTSSPWSVYGVLPHMHLLGRSITVRVAHANLTLDCLADIPRWDFEWQRLYTFRDDPVTVRPGERVLLRCFYDNTQANQPWVDGEQLTPRDVRWGEESLDEMCVAFVAITEPF